MRLIEISAWNDSGGGFLNRLLDGHPALHVWPYELLLGTDGAAPDAFGESWFRGRFRWPRLGDVDQVRGSELFDRLSDAELKGVLCEPATAKHADFRVDVPLAAWRSRVDILWDLANDRSQAAFLSIYIESFFASWTRQPLPAEATVLGHCPVAILDAEEVWHDFPETRIVHVIRRPEAGFHDMRRRHAGLDAPRYAAKWNLINGYAAVLAGKYPKRVRLVTLDDLLARRAATLASLCAWLGIGFVEGLLQPSWNGRPLNPGAMGPFGGVPEAILEVEQDLAQRISEDERGEIARLCAGTRDLLGSVHDIRV